MHIYAMISLKCSRQDIINAYYSAIPGALYDKAMLSGNVIQDPKKNLFEKLGIKRGGRILEV